MRALSGVTAVVLASGLSRRYGAADKLLADLGGQPLASHVAEALGSMPFGERIAVVGSSEIAALFAGFTVVRNSNAALGQQHSLRLGVEAATGPAVMVCLGDMPFITAEHLWALRDTHARTGKAVATEAPGYLGPPAIFNRERLLGEPGAADAGARRLLGEASRVIAPSGMVRDFDVPEDFDLP